MLYEYHLPPWVAWRDALGMGWPASGDWSADSPMPEDAEQRDDTEQKDRQPET